MRLILCAICVFMGALLFAIPNLTRRELLFAVPVPPDLRQSRAGRQAIASFRSVVAAATAAAAAALLLSPVEWLGAAATTAPAVILLAGIGSFYRQNRKLAPHAVQFAGARELEPAAGAEPLPRFAWLAAGPFAILGATAVWLYLHADRIPEKFPVHFGAGGQPDRWAERTFRGVYGPLVFAAGLCAWFVVMGLAGWCGSRRLPSRPVMLGGIIAIAYVMAVLFSLIGLQPALGIPVWAIVLAPMVMLIPILVGMAKKMTAPGEPAEATPNECWKGAIFYYNRKDPALVVEKREGLGYTFNFANRWSWVLLVGLGAVIASAGLVLP